MHCFLRALTKTTKILLFLILMFTTATAVPAPSQNDIFFSTVKNRIPKTSHKIIDWFEGTSNTFVINIQDFHGNYATQKTYAPLFDALFDAETSLNISFIGLEGSSGLIDTGVAASLPDENIKIKLADYFLKSGSISGTEYYSIITRKPAILLGIDDTELYRKNAELFFRITNDLKDRSDTARQTLSYLHDMTIHISEQALNESERELLSYYMGFHSHEISLVDFSRYVIAEAKRTGTPAVSTPLLDKLHAALKLQENINLQKLEMERKTLIKGLKQVLAPEEAKKINTATMQFSVGIMPIQSYYTLLNAYADAYPRAANLNLPELQKMLKVISALSYIKEPAIKQELYKVLECILEHSSHAKENKALFTIARTLAIMDNLLSLNASREEYDFYSYSRESSSLIELINTLELISKTKTGIVISDSDTRNMDYLLSLAGQFYEQALKRDEQMVDNALKMNTQLLGKTILLVTGGFHSEGVARILKERSISYVVLRPELGSANLESSYKETMLNNVSPFDSMLKGLTEMLMPSSNFNNLLYPENQTVITAKWIICASVLSALPEAQKKGIRKKDLTALLQQRQQEWLDKLEQTLTTRYGALIDAGLTDQGTIRTAVDHFKRLLESIKFDYSNYQYTQNTLSVPLIIQEPTPQKVIVSISPETDPAVAEFPSFLAQVLDKANIEPYEIRVWPQEEFEKQVTIIDSLTELDIPLTPVAKQTIMGLLDLFGNETVEKLRDKYDPKSFTYILDEFPDYSEIHDLIQAIGLENATALLLWDIQGFLNIVYGFHQDPDIDFISDYVDKLLTQKKLIDDRVEQMPGFIVEEATSSDLSSWFGYGIPRFYDHDRWSETIMTNDIFLKATAPNGEILGLISARPHNKEKVVFIDLLESTQTQRLKGIGKALVLATIKESLSLGLEGKIVIVPESGSEDFWTDLGFVTSGIKYWRLSAKEAQKLINATKTKDAPTTLPPLVSGIFLDYMQIEGYRTMPLVKSIERFSALMKKYDSLTNDDKLFILAQLMRFYKLTPDQAENMLKATLRTPASFEEQSIDLYDLMVNLWMEEQNPKGTDDDLAVIRPVVTEPPTKFPTLPSVITLDMLQYEELLSTMRSLEKILKDSRRTGFNQKLGDKPSSVRTVQRLLQDHGLLMDVQILPANDPRIAGRVSVLIDNVVYMSQDATRADLWFYLPHELSHLFGGETKARLHDAENIQYMKDIAATLLAASRKVTDTSRKNDLIRIHAALLYTALSYELDILTARLQLTWEGGQYLNENNLPVFKNVDTNYLLAVANSTNGIIPSRIIPDLSDTLSQWGNDTALTNEQFTRRIEMNIVRNILDFSVKRFQAYPDTVDELLSSWVEEQFNRRFWQITKAGIPSDLKPYVKRSFQELGYIDITDIQSKIIDDLRRKPAGAKKAALERTVAQWVGDLIRNNIAPETEINELPSILLRRTTNCLGYSKLFATIGSQFGLSVRKVLLEYEYKGQTELHAVTLVKFADGTTKLIDLIPPENATLKNIILRVNEGGVWKQKRMTMKEFSQLKSVRVDGVDQNTIDAFTYSTRATVALEKKDIEKAFEYMVKAHDIDPENEFIALNTAELIYIHWRKSLEEIQLNPDQNEITKKLKSLFAKFRLSRLGPGAWDTFLKITQKDEKQLLAVNMIIKGPNGIDGYGKGPRKVEKIARVDTSNRTDERRFPAPQEPPKKEEKIPETQPTQPIAGGSDALVKQLEMMATLNRMQLAQQPQGLPRVQQALDQYKINTLTGSGVEFNTARRLLQIGHTLDTMIRQQQYKQAEAMIQGLDPNFAERVLREFPWVMAFMLELYPQWWRGPELRELARQAQVSEDIKKMVREQMTSVRPVTETRERDEFGKKYPRANLIWDSVKQENLFSTLQGLVERGKISETHFRKVYDFLSGYMLPDLPLLSRADRYDLIGKTDEIPLEGGLYVQNGFILGGSFRKAPTPTTLPAYISYMDGMITEHPKELAYALQQQESHFDNTLSVRLGLPAAEIADSIAQQRGGLSIVADEVLSEFSDAELRDAIVQTTQTNDLKYMLEALFASNLQRAKIRDFILKTIKMGILDQKERDTLFYLHKYYVDGDESTIQFIDALSVVEQLVRDYPQIRDTVVDLAVNVRNSDPGKMLYAFMRITPPAETPARIAERPATPLLKDIDSSRRFVEQAL